MKNRYGKYLKAYLPYAKNKNYPFLRFAALDLLSEEKFKEFYKDIDNAFLKHTNKNNGIVIKRGKYNNIDNNINKIEKFLKNNKKIFKK